MDKIQTELWSVLILVGLALLGAFRTVLAEKVVSPIKRFFIKEKLDDKTITCGREINNILVEFRVKMNADRATIFLFHNGQHFNPKIINNSIWKFTSAYETCKEGIAYESQDLQNLLITNHLHLVESLWGKIEEGYEKYSCINCAMDCTKTKNIIIIADVEKMGYSHTKNMLQLQGVKKFIISPIIIGDDYVGFVSASYLSSFNYATQLIDGKDSLSLGLNPICHYANKIGYYLSLKS
jgi:hypothetical protein